jgi:hypothetical protein
MLIMNTPVISVRSLLPSFFCGLLLLLLIGWNSRKQDKILIFSKNVDNQPSAAAAARAFRTLAETADLTVDTTTNAAYITEDSLKNYRAVVFLNTSQMYCLLVSRLMLSDLCRRVAVWG